MIEANAYDRAVAQENAAQERRVRNLEWRLASAEAHVDELITKTDRARSRVEDLRARLAVARTQLRWLRHPAAGVDLTDRLDASMQRALAGADQGRRPASAAGEADPDALLSEPPTPDGGAYHG